MSLFLLLNPKQYPTGITVDTSDILDVYRKRQRKEQEELEEALAVQLLQAKQEDVVIPASIDADRLGEILQAKMHQVPGAGELKGVERVKRIRLLLLVMAMED